MSVANRCLRAIVVCAIGFPSLPKILWFLLHFSVLWIWLVELCLCWPNLCVTLECIMQFLHLHFHLYCRFLFFLGLCFSLFLSVVVCSFVVSCFVVGGLDDAQVSLQSTKMCNVRLFYIFCRLLFLLGMFVDVLLRNFPLISSMELVFVVFFVNSFFVYFGGNRRLHSNLCCLILVSPVGLLALFLY